MYGTAWLSIQIGYELELHGILLIVHHLLKEHIDDTEGLRNLIYKCTAHSSGWRRHAKTDCLQSVIIAQDRRNMATCGLICDRNGRASREVWEEHGVPF